MRNRLIGILTLLFAMVVSVMATDYVYVPKHGVEVAWNADDVFGIYTPSSTCLEFKYSELAGDSHSASVVCPGWALGSGRSYTAYSPYNVDIELARYPVTALPFSYDGQKQTTNNSLAHLAAYDFQSGQTTTTDDAAIFDMTHLGCILRIACYMPKRTIVTGVTLSADAPLFASQVTADITNNSLSTVKTSETVSLGIDNVIVQAEDSLVAYVMIAPVDLSGKELTLTINGTITRTATLKGTKLQAGKVYPISIGTMNYMSETVNVNSAKAVMASIDNPKANTNDFVIDEENVFEVTEIELPEPEPEPGPAPENPENPEGPDNPDVPDLPEDPDKHPDPPTAVTNAEAAEMNTTYYNMSGTNAKANDKIIIYEGKKLLRR